MRPAKFSAGRKAITMQVTPHAPELAATRNDAAEVPCLPPARLRRRHGAIGKALIVWLLSGSLGLAIVAFLVLSLMGC